MALCFELVDPAPFADRASGILHEAWQPPALRYSPEFLRWQFAFPAPVAFPAAAAFDGPEAVGFAGITARRLRFGSFQWPSGVVSFVAVRPAWRGRGVAAGLYARLLDSLRRAAIPVITFAVAGSGGERALLRAYPQAGFRMQPIGAYPVYGCIPRGEVPPAGADWQATVSSEIGHLSAIVENCAADGAIIWNDPDPAQTEHYLRDPRPRRFLLLENRLTGERGAAWTVQVEFRTLRGVETVTTVDSIFLPRRHGAALPALLRCAAASSPAASARQVIQAPGLYGFDAASLRAAGIRQTGPQFQAQLCAPELPVILRGAAGTSLEVV